MKVVLVSVLLVAVAQAALQPRDVRLPEWKVNPRLSGAEWQQVLANQEFTREVVEDFKAGTERQIDGAGAIRGDGNTKVVGGSNAVYGQFPWQVAIRMDGSYFCGGSIISDKWVLTAGHCVDGYSSFILVFGSLSPVGGSSGTAAQISRTSILHAGYDANTIANDIGLVEVDPITWSSQIGPVRLPSRSQVGSTFVDQTVLVSGWGLTSDTASTISGDLKFTDLTVISNTDCALTYPFNILASNICTSGTQGRSPCSGDSGGPLVLQESDGLYTEVGLVSFGSSAGCELGYPAAFTRVTSYLDWIETNSGIIIS